MRISRRLTSVAVGAAVLAATVAAAPAASATSKLGSTSLASVLLADGDTFDKNPYDYDIVTQAALAVLEAKPGSAVGVLTDGSVKLTAFIPTDQAFRLLVKDLTGTSVASEQAIFNAVAGLGIDTVETVLLYHVVPGATITAKQALASDGASLTTAQGGALTVRVFGSTIRLVDADPDDWNAKVVKADINKGNKQIAHGIHYVLRPVNL